MHADSLHLIALTALGIGLVILIGLVQSIWRMKQAKTWPHTIGVVTEATTRGRWCRIGSGRTWIEEPVVSYHYEVNGVALVGHTLALAEIDTASKRYAEGKISDLSVGKEVTVYFDPHRPQTSALDVTSKLAPFVLVGIVSLILLVFGVLVLMGVIRFN